MEPNLSAAPDKKSGHKIHTVTSIRRLRTMLRKHVRAAFFLGVSAAICILSVVSIYLSLRIISVTHTLKLAGILQAIEQSTPVKHDLGGVLSEVFVTEGEVVREGQILAALSTEELRTDLFTSRKEVAGLLLRARCLRSLSENQSDFQVPEKLKQVLGRLQQVEKMRRESKACSVALRQNALDVSHKKAEIRAALDLARLYSRLSETNQIINGTSKKLSPYKRVHKEISEQDLEFMKSVLVQSIEANKARASHDALVAEFEKEQMAKQLEYDQERQRISDMLQEAQSELTRMESLMADKFIYASSSGRVQRMRIGDPGKRVAAGAYVLEIAPLKTDFEVTSEINLAQAPNLGLGQLVHIQLSGGMPKPIWVPARVDKILKISENKRLVSIRMSREDLNKRDLLMGDNSLNGLGERSEAIISITSETAWKSLSGTVKSIFRKSTSSNLYDV